MNGKEKKTQKTAAAGSFFQSRKFKYGSVATGLTIVFVAVVVIVNVIFSLLTSAYSWKLDTTSYALYSISDSVKQVVSSLKPEEKIEITVMYREEEYPEQFRETILRFAALSDQIECSFVDPDVNPQALTAYGNEYKIEEGSIVVKNGDRIRVTPFADLYTTDSQTGAVTYNTEQCLGSAVLYVTKEDIPLIYFLTGHGESGYEALMSLFANNGADVEEVNISRLASVDAKARLIVIAGPTIDYSEPEIRLLQEFLANDYNYQRDMMVFHNPNAPRLKNLDTLLAEWGMQFGDNLVLEDDAHSASTYASSVDTVPLYLIPSYTEAKVSDVTITADYLSVVPNCSTVDLLFEEEGITSTTALMDTSADSYAKSNQSINAGYAKEAEDPAGPFHVAAIGTRYKYQNNVAVESHLFACGSVDVLNSSYITNNGNGEFLYKVYQMMEGEQEIELIGASKTAYTTNMGLSTAAIRWISIVFIGLIPLAFLAIGLIVYIRRRFL